ncbi:MAG: hypothetical protein MR803_08645 [Clostridiales bacterium]|nr:hypothetical protein [Clostridiales bacterium]
MARDISRTLIETVVRKMLREAKDAPERSIRNLVDMALYFSNGRYQRNFFTVAQEMLRNEQSAYYPLLRDLLAHVDEERLLDFGMALGYQGFVRGAKTIRAAEAEFACHVPWFLTLHMDSGAYPGQRADYRRLLEQARTLGTHGCLLLTDGEPRELIDLAADFPDCFFLLACGGELVTAPLAEEAERVHNLVFAPYGEQAEEACALLREKRFLYALSIRYGAAEAENIAGGEWYSWAENCHAPLTLLLPDRDCPAQAQERVYDSVLSQRRQQAYRTIPWEAVRDGRLVDSVLSGAPCTVTLDSRGFLEGTEENAFALGFPALLKRNFPRKTNG